MEKKIFLSLRGPLHNTGAYARMLTLNEVKLYFTGNLTVVSVLAGKTFERLLVVSCKESDTDTFVKRWADEPEIVLDYWIDHVGTFIEIDDKVVYNDLKPSEPEDHDRDCEICAKSLS